MGLLCSFSATGAEVEASKVLEQLQAGNLRYSAGKLIHPNQTVERRSEVAKGQHPMATILTCSDSRVPVETIFDQGIGDLFVVRVAGNVARTDEIASVEYGVGHLHAPVVIVLGHTKCGAVSAVAKGSEVGGSIPELISPIVPVVAKVRADNPGIDDDTLVAKAVTANVWASIEAIFSASAEVRELVKTGKLQILGGVYDLDSGVVSVMGAHPLQASLLAAAKPEATSETAAPRADRRPVESTASPIATTPVASSTELPTSVGIVGIGSGVVILILLIWGAYAFSRSGIENWTVGRRIGVGFGVLLLLLTCLVGISIRTFRATYVQFTEYRADARHSVLVGRIQANFLEMRIAARGYQLSRNKSDVEHFDTRRKKVHEFLAEANTALSASASDLKLASDLSREVGQYETEFSSMCVKDATDAQIREIAKQMALLGEEVDRQIENMKLAIVANQNRLGPIIQANLQYTLSLMLWIGAAAFALGVSLAIVISRSITGPMKLISDGISGGATQTTSAATQVSEASQSLAKGASEQAASLEETSSSLEELASMTKRNADSAVQATTVAADTRAAADLGATDMAAMKNAMDAIKVSSGEIAKIVKTIDEIAFQTNILALNAAVEAARAGEAGAGFAVVAEEVRSLAQRSAEAAKETAAKIEDSVSKSEHGVRISGKVADSLQQIVERARKMDSLVAEIARASQEQTQGISQVNTAVAQMDKITQSNASSAEETAAAAEELSAQAMSLQEASASLQRLIIGSRA